jgi:antitoxin (DNA-binding transcriptional repressor) of toxin-antitoxin stability system
MATIPIQQAQAELPALIHGLAPGDELIITENNKPVARIVSSAPNSRKRQLGSMPGTVLHMAPDFDAPLDEFSDYTA